MSINSTNSSSCSTLLNSHSLIQLCFVFREIFAQTREGNHSQRTTLKGNEIEKSTIKNAGIFTSQDKKEMHRRKMNCKGIAAIERYFKTTFRQLSLYWESLQIESIAPFQDPLQYRRIRLSRPDSRGWYRPPEYSSRVCCFSQP